MPIDRRITRSIEDDETLLIIHDPEHHYSHSEICDLLDEAEKLGLELDGPELKLIHNARELEILVRRRQ
jgi:hypothetical protein